MMVSDELKELIEKSPVRLNNGFPYAYIPITDGVPSIEPRFLKEVCEGMIGIGDFDCDMILAPEAMGIPYGTLISQMTGIPMSIIRKRKSVFEGQVEVLERTGYNEIPMYINGVKKGDRVVIVDDIIDTGGSIKAFVKGLKEIGCEIVCAVMAIDKSKDLSAIAKETGIEIRALIKIDIIDDKIHVVD